MDILERVEARSGAQTEQGGVSTISVYVRLRTVPDLARYHEYLEHVAPPHVCQTFGTASNRDEMPTSVLGAPAPGGVAEASVPSGPAAYCTASGKTAALGAAAAMRRDRQTSRQSYNFSGFRLPIVSGCFGNRLRGPRSYETCSERVCNTDAPNVFENVLQRRRFAVCASSGRVRVPRDVRSSVM